MLRITNIGFTALGLAGNCLSAQLYVHMRIIEFDSNQILKQPSF